MYIEHRKSIENVGSLRLYGYSLGCGEADCRRTLELLVAAQVGLLRLLTFTAECAGVPSQLYLNVDKEEIVVPAAGRAVSEGDCITSLGVGSLLSF